jgi:hypothetical protein
MCFSASASFGAAVVLTTIGIGATKQAIRPGQKMFAAIPLMFALQQLAEGFIWLSFTNPDFLAGRQIYTYSFLAFAQVIWPFWVPVSIMLLEKDYNKIKALQFLSLLGLCVSTYMAYCLFSYPVRAEAANYHIAYYMDLPPSALSDNGISYILATILPALIAGTKKVWLFGLTILLSFLLTKVFFTEYLISVWCFFAAITSGVIYYILFQNNSEAIKVNKAYDANTLAHSREL